MRLIIVSLVVLISGCASSVDKVVPPDRDKNMRSVYYEYGGGDEEGAYAKRSQALMLRDAQAMNTTTGLPPHPERIKHLFPKIKNPDLFMYVRPQAVGVSGAPIPAFITRFSMYEKTHYALPGETVETLRDKAIVDESIAARDREIEYLKAKESREAEQTQKLNTVRQQHRKR